MTDQPLRIVGVPASPYSRKMRAVLRYRRIPYAWVHQGSPGNGVRAALRRIDAMRHNAEENDMAIDPEAARQGLLKFIAKKGGAIPIRELHTHSLVFYQAGHQAFSQLMEGLVSDGLVTYDDATAVFSLTEKGRAALGVS